MVCSIESGRMAAMARILDASSFSQSIPAENGHKKFISQYIHRGLCAADEANLLDEEDMHVYGLMPMEDTLHLVCCNACKKPVKASQYATHSEFCRLLSYGETIVEVNGGAEHRKSRKERKKLIKTHSYKITIAQEHKRSESIKGDDTVASESRLDYQAGRSSFISIEDKNMETKMDHSGGSPGCTDQSGSIVPAKKRSKGIADDPLTLSDDLEAVCGVAEVIQQEETAYIPAPLATKIFYSQRNNHLRSAISHMYHGASTKEESSEL